MSEPVFASNADEAAPDALPETAEAVVVGAGAVGLSIAYELAGRGMETAVVERGTAGVGTSSGNAGFVVPSHVIPVPEPGMFAVAVRSMLSGKGPVTVRSPLRPGLWRWAAAFLRNCRPQAVEAAAPMLAALGNLSAGLFQEWLDGEGMECAYERNGLLNVFGGPRELAAGRHRAEWEAKFGVPIQILDGDEAREMEPALNGSVTGAVFYPDDAGLDPGRFMAGLAAAAIRRGVRVVSNTEVLGAETGGGKVRRLVTTRGEIRAGETVLAAGAWTPQLAARFGNRLPIQPAKGYSVTVRRPRRGPRRRMLLGEKYVAVAPMGDLLRMSGWFELGRLDSRLPPSRLAQVERNARSRLDLDSDLRVTQRWAGFRPVTPDGVPVIGRAPGWTNLSYAAGHALLGLSLAPATGRLAAQVIYGETTDVDIGPCSPERFQ